MSTVYPLQRPGVGAISSWLAESIAKHLLGGFNCPTKMFIENVANASC